MKTLNDLFTQTSGKALKKSNQNGSLHKYITTSNLFWGRFDFSEVREMYFMENELEKCTAKKGDLLVCNGGDVGRSAVWEYDYDICLQNHITRLRPKSEDVFPKFYYYAMYYIKNNELINGNGVGIASLSAKELMSIKVPHPSLPEQQKIVAHLDSIQSAIDNKKQQLQQLDELVKSKFVEMFHDKEFPKKKIGEIISISRGASPRPISAFVTNDFDGMNWIKIGDVSEDSLYIEKTSERITKEGADKSRYVKPGDFILSNSMSFGRPYILKIHGCVHDGWLILSNYENTFNPLFLYYELRDDDVQTQFDGSANGATVRNLNSDIVKGVDVAVPPIELQNNFAAYVQKIDSAKSIIKNQLADLQELLDSKMDEYFGE